MTPAALKQLKQDALALRNIACKVLEQVQQWELNPAAPAQPKQKQLERMAGLQARIMTGRRKPASTK